MKQKREEREAEIQKMIAAGEDPFAKRPREGYKGAGMCVKAYGISSVSKYSQRALIFLSVLHNISRDRVIC